MLSRRSFITAAVSSTLAFPLINLNSARGASYDPAPAPFGRISRWVWVVRDGTTFSSKIVKYTKFDDVIPLTGVTRGQVWGAHANPYWYVTDGGFIHTAQVQPVTDAPNVVESETAAKGTFWAEVTVPFATARVQPSDKAWSKYKLYHGTVYRVIDLSTDDAGVDWYRLRDGLNGGGWVRATALRRFTASELQPLNQDVEDKRVVVDMVKSMVIAYEDDREVYSTPCATGTRKDDQWTPGGDWRVIFKRPTSHMSGDLDKPADAFDLPGVSFPTFFTNSGVAIHGTFWHNDWGARRSHGCVNVSDEAALWYWRWTTPVSNNDKDTTFVRKFSEGTRVSVQY